jgi:hypothetical protein
MMNDDSNYIQSANKNESNISVLEPKVNKKYNLSPRKQG